MSDELAKSLPSLPAIDPASRQRGTQIHGVPTKLGDDQLWSLSNNFHTIGDVVWDRLYDGNVGKGEYNRDDLRLAAVYLLLANYDLDVDEAVNLILHTPTEHLVEPVETAMFGPRRKAFSYSDWVETTLYANGLNPHDMPGHRVRDVLDYLVAIGKAIPESNFVTAAVRSKKRGKFRALANQQAAAREAAAKANVPPEPPAPNE